MKKKFLFQTGMFRSGTTLTSRILTAHPNIAFSTDPYRPFFNDFRDRLAELHGLKTQREPQTYLNSYFCDDEELKLMKIVQNSDLNIAISPSRLRHMLSFVKRHQVINGGNEMCPKITPHLHRIKGRTYREVFVSMMSLVDEYYGKKEARYTGIKDGWCTEFVAPLARTFPGTKFVLVLRNPRAVFASNVAMREYDPKTHTFKDKKARYPWLFLIRQWRKLAIFTWLFSTSPAYKKSVQVLRYEDLVASPSKSMQGICDFLGLDFDSSMVEADSFQWTQNSSYGSKEKGITSRYQDKWKEMLKPDDVRLIERLCFAEMKIFGYEPTHTDMTPMHVLNPPVLKPTEVATWIERLSNLDPLFNVTDMAKERLRKELLALSDQELRKIDPRVIEGFYIDRRYFDKAREITKRGKIKQ